MRSLVLCVIGLPGMACAAAARIDAGNVVLEAADGSSRVLTTSGRDREAELSPDGRWVVFVRDGAANPEGEGLQTEIRVVPAHGGVERVLVTSGRACGRNPRLDGLATPQFLTDSRRIVFESRFVATSGSVQQTSLRHGGCRYVAPANEVTVIRGGRHRDRLILNQHRYFLAGGSYDWYWLVSLDGRAEGPVGPDLAAVADFLDEVGLGEG